jgi:RNA polymerase sigma-70 factor (ECF subfamily)
MAVSSPDLSESLARYRDTLARYIRGMVRNDAEAEDLTQETLLRAYAKLPSLEDPARLAPWLYRIATNVTYDRFRQASYRYRPVSLDEASSSVAETTKLEILPDNSPRLDKLMEQREMSLCVRDYIEKLSDPYRAVILLHDVQGLTNPEIAEMLELSLATVKIRLHRARAKLRAALGEGCLLSQDDRGVQVCEPKVPRDPCEAE